jgi:nucleotidyltransferase/DNA polymerase involved in DNA repair
MSQASFSLPHDRGNPGSIACISVPHFALRVALLERPELDGEPLVLGPLPGTRANVSDATPEAQSRGIRPGMSVREAIALCSEAVILSPNLVREATVADHLLTRLEQLSPLVEADASIPGTWYVDLLGLERHLGPPAQATAKLLATLPSALRPRAGVGTGKFTARVAAGHAAPGEPYVVAPDETAAFLSRVAVRWLPLPVDDILRLEALGLHTLGELAALPAAKIAARFGPPGRHVWELARGNDPEPVRPRDREPTVTEWMDLPAPATSRETLLLALGQLVEKAFRRPVLRGRAVRQARLRLRLEGGSSWAKALTLRSPYVAADLIRALRLRLENLELPGPAESVALDLTGLTAETGTQERLPGYRTRWTTPLIEATRHLKQRYGDSPLFQVIEVEPWSRIPERRHALLSYDP